MIVAFDLNGTLTDVRALLGDDRSFVVFDRALMLAMAGSLSGAVRPLPELFREVLERDHPELAAAAMDRLPRLPAQPEAEEALTTLREAGHRVAVVTNSAADAGDASLRAAGLRDLVDEVIGIDGLGTYKPDPRVYANAADRLGGQGAFVAAHAWDVEGATRAGWRGVLVDHDAGPTLSAVAKQLA